MFREASLKLKFGDVLGAVFPKWSFPPSLPYVRTGEAFDPLADIGAMPGVETSISLSVRLWDLSRIEAPYALVSYRHTRC